MSDHAWLAAAVAGGWSVSAPFLLFSTFHSTLNYSQAKQYKKLNIGLNSYVRAYRHHPDC